MPLSEATISYDLADLGGVDFDARRTKVWATTNLAEQTVIDTDGNKIRLGTANGTIAADGTGSIVVWTPGTGSNPDSWQTYIHVDYPDRNKTGGRGKRTFGPFTVTASANLADLVEEQEVPATYISQVTAELDTYVASATAASESSAASATSAAASADLAKSVADIDTPDALVATLVEDSGSATGAALSATIAREMQTPEAFGAKGDGITDDTAALAAWAASGARGLALSAGKVYLTSAPITHPPTLRVVEGNGATIKATNTGAFVWQKTSGTGLIGLRITNLTLDCGLHMSGMKLVAVSRGDISGLRVLNSKGYGLSLGDAAGSKSNGMRITDYKAEYTTQPVGSVGLALFKANDTHIASAEIYGAETGVLTDATSFNTVMISPHVWGLAANRPVTCYDMSAGAMMYRPFADTPSQYGFRLRNGGPFKFNSPEVYISPAEGNDNTAIGFKLDGYLTASITDAAFIGGDATHRLAADIEGPLQFVTSTPAYYFQTVAQRLVATPRRREWQPENSGMKAWAFDPVSTVEFARPTAGQLQLVRLPWQPGELVTTVYLNFQAGGTGLTAGQCFAAIFDESGNWLASSTDRAANWASSGVKTCNLTSPTRCNDPYVWVGFYWNGTTGPQVYRGATIDAVNAVSATPRFATGSTGLTTAMPASTARTASPASWWCAIA